MSDRAENTERIVDGYKTVVRELDRFMLPRLIELELTMPQFKALVAVMNASEQGISVTELGNRLSVGQPSASLIVDQLVRADFVERVQDVEDRRRVLVRLTELGTEVTGELRHGRSSTFRAWLAQLTEDDAKALSTGLSALAEIIDAESAGA